MKLFLLLIPFICINCISSCIMEHKIIAKREQEKKPYQFIPSILIINFN